MMPEAPAATPKGPATPPSRKRTWAGFRGQALLLLILILGGYLRFVGINWDENTHLHPDERFLTLVETSIQIPGGLSEYFDTDHSPLNPHNTGHTFFVYGTFPIFLVRYLGEWLGRTGYDEIHLVGRAASAAFDLVSILLIYLIGRRLHSERVGLLAALLTALSVLLIQHAHFFVVDPIANSFMLAGIYFAVRAMDTGELRDFLLFGVALGLAVASKISAAPLAATLALAAGIRVWQTDPQDREAQILRLGAYLVAAALVSLVVFRIFQPYAFAGPSFWNVKLNPRWLANMAEIREQQRGNTDAPFALQWADREPVWFSFKNLLLWGLGLPLGLAAWFSWGWALLESLRGRWRRHLLPTAWTGAFFLWQSIGFTKAMRYQLPIYPLLAMFAAWGLWEGWKRSRDLPGRAGIWGPRAVAAAGLLVVGLTAAWAFAFHSIYRQPFSRAEASRWIYRHIPGVVNLVIDVGDEEYLEVVPMPQDFILHPEAVHIVEIKTDLTGEVREIWIPYAQAPHPPGGEAELEVTLTSEPDSGDLYARVVGHKMLGAGQETEFRMQLATPLPVDPERRLFLNLKNQGGTAIAMRGSVLVHETSWDDGMPWGLEGRNLNGRYEVRNLELYWNDDQDDDQNGVPDKIERIAASLEQGEYLIISSNRQYGTIPRVTIRYPLTTAYYRALFGCPEPQPVLVCGARLEVGEHQGQLGYVLFQVFESHPSLGSLEINDQFAEEAFTVYDHPKVLIFRKQPDFKRERVEAILGQVDVSRVQHVLPKDAGGPVPKDLMLPEARWQQQQTAGTWSALFDPARWIHRSTAVTVVAWWLAIGLLGLLMFPINRLIFRGFHDQGYALSRLMGLLLFAWFAWMAGSLGIGVGRGTLWAILAFLAILSGSLAWSDRRDLAAFFRSRWREVLWIEAFALAFFLLDLAIRFGNPDLWHPAKGGEKPMDFSYLNAVLKSRTFPPYDPWFAAGYINYYYYGFVLVGMPVKLLGIVPYTAYNLILPTWLALLALSGYSVAYHLVAAVPDRIGTRLRSSPRLAGVVASILLVVLGNLGTLRMFYDGFKRIGTPPGQEQGRFLVGAAHAARGFARYVTFQEQQLYPLDQWYWNPSRAITPGEGEAGPITEFPFFTFLYGDLHAHMISRPLTVLSLAWGLAWILWMRRGGGRLVLQIPFLGIGGLILGALRPTNTWDFPVYWGLGAVAVAYGVWERRRSFEPRQLMEMVLSAALLLGMAQILYQPYHHWYGLGYESARLWEGSRTPLLDYFTVHGVFIFLIVAWMAWESYAWMATTPLSALAKLRPYAGWIGVFFLLLVAVTAGLVGLGYRVGLIVLPLTAWAGVLLLRPGMPLGKRAALVFAGIGLLLTLLVEVVVLEGDISRMNTVFKFYLQVWELFSLAAGAALAWSYATLEVWRPILRRLWLALVGLLLFGAALYPMTASFAKIEDRMEPMAPKTLDGMLFMRYVDRYSEIGEPFTLREDYAAIRWMQDNIEGTPVIVEANVPEYRWGTRYTIYTGLPGVLGWRWHQFQQRVAADGNQVDNRLFDITRFYLTQSREDAWEFLEKYGVRYIVLGQLEKAYYEAVWPCFPAQNASGVTCNLRGWPLGMPTIYEHVPAKACEPLQADDPAGGLRCPTRGLEKFTAMVADGDLKVVFQQGGTMILEVVRP